LGQIGIVLHPVARPVPHGQNAAKSNDAVELQAKSRKSKQKQHTCNNIDRHLTEASKIAAKAMLGCLQASGGLWGVELAAWRWQKYVIIAFEGFHEICQIHTTP